MEFTDGMKFDTSGPLRIIRKSDGLYVVGQGMLMAVETWDEGQRLVKKFSARPEGGPR